MSFGKINKQDRPSSSSFSDLKKENTFTQENRIHTSNALTQVKPSYIPNPKTIGFSLIGIVLVGAIVAVAVVLVKINQAHGSSNITDDNKGNSSSASTAVTTNTRSTSLTMSTSTVGSSALLSSTSTSTSAQQNATSTQVTPPGTGIWSEWDQWTLCPVTCGTGLRTRYRVCQNRDQYADCLGGYIDQGLCFTSTCPVYGKWRSWSQWSGCDRTCGNGTQLRSRSCLTTSSADLDCVGENTQSQACNTYMCPDCNKTCNSGNLNADCDRCECATNVTGRVVDRNNFPLASVSIAESTTPYTILAESDSVGSFVLKSTCIGTNIVLRKENYQDTTVTCTRATLQITMEHIVLPYITSEPCSKSRLSGENATLCCTARGSPDIIYYEWFKNGVNLDKALYPDGTSLMLSNLTFLHSGQYNCRANSLVGSIQSESATLLVRDKSSDFCAASYQQKMQTLPEDCVQPGTNKAQYEVGECVSMSCRLDESPSEETCQEGMRSCCAASGYNIVTIDCTGYQINLAVVTGCSCQACGDKFLSVNGLAMGMDSDLPLIYGQIWVNGVLETETNELGEFSFTVPMDVKKLTITAKDTYYNQFLDITKIFNIPDDLEGTIQMTLRLFHASKPIIIDSSVENRIYLGNSSSIATTPTAEIVVPPNSFLYPNGSRYNNTVSASLTYLDPTNRTVLENIPGVFQFIDSEGNTQDLDTLGVFGLFFQDANGDPLTIDGSIDIFLTNDVVATDPDAVSNYKIWGLSEITGKWEIISVEGESKTRRRRQIQLWIGEINYGSYSWYNIDKFRNSTSLCYFKTRIYKSFNLSDANEIVDLPNYLSLTFPIFRGFSASQWYGSTRYPSKTCHEVICENDPGFLEVRYWNSNTYKYETLIPANPGNIGVNVGLNLAAQSLINYNVSENGRILRLRFKSANDGPFYSNINVCTNSTVSSNHFRFFFLTGDQDVYTFMKFYTLFTNASISSKVWYPVVNSYVISVCCMKVRLSFLGRLESSQSIKLRVFSYGGKHNLTKGFLFGIREVEISANTSVCIEYKCGGQMQKPATSTDRTRVQIFPIISSTIKCNVSSDALYSELPAENENNTGRSIYTNLAPDYWKEKLGIFGESGVKADLSILTAKSNASCIASTYSAVEFTCSNNYSG